MKYLMGAYFHQDWVLNGANSSDTVETFLNERRQLVTDCADQIEELLQQDFSEGALRAQLADWGSDYYAGDTDDDYRLWLADICGQLRAACEQ